MRTAIPSTIDVSRRLAFVFGALSRTIATRASPIWMARTFRPCRARRTRTTSPTRPIARRGAARMHGNLPLHASRRACIRPTTSCSRRSGPGAELFHGRIDNTRVFRDMATALGLTPGTASEALRRLLRPRARPGGAARARPRARRTGRRRRSNRARRARLARRAAASLGGARPHPPAGPAAGRRADRKSHPENGARVADVLLEMASEARATLLIVSHDPALLARVGTIYRLEAGRLGAATGRAS